MNSSMFLFFCLKFSSSAKPPFIVQHSFVILSALLRGRGCPCRRGAGDTPCFPFEKSKKEEESVLVNAREMYLTAISFSVRPHFAAITKYAVFVSLYKEYHLFFEYSTIKNPENAFFRFFVELTKNGKNVLWKWLSVFFRSRAFACILLVSLFGSVGNELYTLLF